MFKRQNEIPAYLTGIDIGSTAIRIAVGQYLTGQDGKSDLRILGLVEVPSDGVQKGMVHSIEETVSSLSNGLEQVERLIGAPIEHAWIGISGTHILCQDSRGVVAVAKANGEISSEDVDRVVEAARTVAVPLNYEILHVIPRSFNVDGQTGIKDPISMTGIRLEVNAQIIYGITPHIKNITKAVYRTGIDIDDLVVSILATGAAVTTSKQRELGVAVVNIGGSTTSLIVYEGGDILHTTVLPFGSEHITNDLAIGLKTAIDVAERVKIEYGDCLPTAATKKEKIDLVTFGGQDSELITRHYVASIIGARVSEILEKIEVELGKIERRVRLPAGILFTGGGAKASGLVSLAKEQLNLPAAIGYPLFINSGQSQSNDITFTTAIGLVRWGGERLQDWTKRGEARFSSAGKLLRKFQEVWHSLMP